MHKGFLPTDVGYKKILQSKQQTGLKIFEIFHRSYYLYDHFLRHYDKGESVYLSEEGAEARDPADSIPLKFFDPSNASLELLVKETEPWDGITVPYNEVQYMQVHDISERVRSRISSVTNAALGLYYWLTQQDVDVLYYTRENSFRAILLKRLIPEIDGPDRFTEFVDTLDFH